MRKMIIVWLALLPALVSCRSHKEVHGNTVVLTDSVAFNRSLFFQQTLDSAIAEWVLEFDTLTLTPVSLPFQADALPAATTVKVVRGTIGRRSGRKSEHFATSLKIDSIANKLHKNEQIDECYSKSASCSLLKVKFLFVFLAIACAVFAIWKFFLKKKL